VVRHDLRPEPWIQIEANDRSIASNPKPPRVHRRVENQSWRLSRVKAEHPLQQIGIASFPDRWQRLVRDVCIIARVSVDPLRMPVHFVARHAILLKIATSLQTSIP